jgi:ABC-type amino acid transport substrate-binding protein
MPFRSVKRIVVIAAALLPWIAVLPTNTASGSDLAVVKKAGVLRHLGVPYANFITGQGDGLDLELMQRFAASLNLKYRYVETSWGDVIPDLIGKRFRISDGRMEKTGDHPIRGDVIANGLTVLEWRQKLILYSTPTFPTQVWLIAAASSALNPIQPTGDTGQDIARVKETVAGKTILGVPDTCLEPSLYGLEKIAKIKYFRGNLNEVAPAVINGESETAILDVPDALIALEKWPGKIKVIGPVSPMQSMGVGFSPSSPELLAAFNRFFERLVRSGEYATMVKFYYPAVFQYFPAFFKVE